MLLNCGVGEDSWESLGLQGDPTSPSYRRSVLGVHWKDWCWSWNSNTLATWCEELTHLKRPDAGKDWRCEEKGTTEDEMVGWHHWLDGHESEQVLGAGDGHGGLACCNPWGHKESDTTERLNWTNWTPQSIVLVLFLLNNYYGPRTIPGAMETKVNKVMGNLQDGPCKGNKYTESTNDSK